MSTFVLMRLLESAPRRYDVGIELLSLGAHRRTLRRLAEQAAAGQQVLDVGCGTGSLMLLCAERGAHVTGIDASPQMLRLARRKLEEATMADRVELREMSSIDLAEAFLPDSFDVVVSSFAFSELSSDEQRFVLAACLRLLRAGGRLAVADEVRPRGWPQRILHLMLRLPLAAVTYALTQTTTHAVTDLESNIAAAGFSIERVDRQFLSAIELVIAVKDGGPR
jgi:ubiquinone/menaquinone biosynthesis C-methylase UbiE